MSRISRQENVDVPLQSPPEPQKIVNRSDSKKVDWADSMDEEPFITVKALPEVEEEEMPQQRANRPKPLRMFSRQFSSRSVDIVFDAADVTLDKMRKFSEVTMSPIGALDEDQDRGNWSNPIEFLLCALAYVVGLGNIWRFPYLVFKNGGGAFFIAYWIMLFLCGLPLVMMELSLGQYWSEGPLSIWTIAPMFKGIGLSMVMITFFCVIYYCMITSWALYYFVMSLRAVLPWACCQDSWAAPDCVSFVQNTSICQGASWPTNASNTWTNTSKFVADYYFNNEVLGISEGLETTGRIKWRMFLALGIAWIIVCAVLMKGVKSLGKISYVTATLPYAVLTALLINSLMQPGSVNGIIYYVTPNWSSLLEARVWSDAASQIFYSSGVCFGGIITMASYNTFKHNIYRDALIIALGDTLTSFFSGLVVFSILGFMAYSQGVTVPEVVSSGAGLTFIAYPQSVTLLNLSPLWSTLFFLMLSTVAMSSMFPMVENLVSSAVDQFRSMRPYKFWIDILICTICFLCGIMLTTGGGMYILQLLDACAVGRAVLFIGLAEVLVVGWRYDAGRLISNITRMIGFHRSLLFWKIVWKFITPVMILFAIIFGLIQEKPLEYASTAYVYPTWATILGWILTMISIAPIPIYAIFKIISYKRGEGREYSVVDSFKYLSIPEEKKLF